MIIKLHYAFTGIIGYMIFLKSWNQSALGKVMAGTSTHNTSLPAFYEVQGPTSQDGGLVVSNHKVDSKDIDLACIKTSRTGVLCYVFVGGNEIKEDRVWDR